MYIPRKQVVDEISEIVKALKGQNTRSTPELYNIDTFVFKSLAASGGFAVEPTAGGIAPRPPLARRRKIMHAGHELGP